MAIPEERVKQLIKEVNEAVEQALKDAELQMDEMNRVAHQMLKFRVKFEDEQTIKKRFIEDFSKTLGRMKDNAKQI